MGIKIEHSTGKYVKKMKQNQDPDDPTLVDLYTAYKVDTDLSTQPPTQTRLERLIYEKLEESRRSTSLHKNVINSKYLQMVAER